MKAPVSIMIDASLILRTYLASQTPLTNLVSSRLWAERIVPLPDYKPHQGQAICFRSRGGPIDYGSQLLRISFQFKCYGLDEARAMTVYRRLFDALHDASYQEMAHARLEIAGQTLREPDTDWPFVLSFFGCIFRNSQE